MHIIIYIFILEASFGFIRLIRRQSIFWSFNTTKFSNLKVLTVTYCYNQGWKIATDAAAIATNNFSLATKNSGLVATLATRFLSDLDLN